MFVNHKKKCVFLHNPKCAGISISNLLKTLGFEMIDTPVMVSNPSIIQRHRWNVPKNMAKYFVFTSIRHPLDRMVSSWAYGVARIDRDIWRLHGKKLTFKEAANLKNFPLPLQKPYAERADFHVRYENLEEDFNKLPFIENKIAMPHENKTDRDKWWEYFSNDPLLLRECIDKWKADFAALPYNEPQIPFL